MGGTRWGGRGVCHLAQRFWVKKKKEAINEGMNFLKPEECHSAAFMDTRQHQEVVPSPTFRALFYIFFRRVKGCSLLKRVFPSKRVQPGSTVGIR